jgi:hypothetical protein
VNGWRTTYKAAKDFRAAGRVFRNGEVLMENDPIARAVLIRRPELLHVRAQRVDAWPRARPTAKREPSREPRPKAKRDWLALEPWRLP